jgi:hypothetical protein
MHRQLAQLWAQGVFPSALVGARGPVTARAAIAADLAADGRWGAAQRSRHLAKRLAGDEIARDLLSLHQRQRQPGASPQRRHDSAAGSDVIENARGRLAERAADRTQPFALSPALPELGALRRAKPHTMILFLHSYRSTPSL